MERLQELVEKEFISLEELEELECMTEVTEVEDNGMSGMHNRKHWYTVKANNEEYDVYVE